MLVNNSYSDQQHVKEWETTSIAIGSVYLIIGVIGIFSNLTVAFLMFREKDFRSNATYVFMINLAIADAIVLTAIAFYAGLHCLINFQSNLWDRIFGYIVAVGWYPGCIFFTIIAFTRWIAMTRSEKLKVYFRKRNLIALIAAPWVLCSLFYTCFLYYNPALFVWLPHLLSWGFDIDSSFFGFYLQHQNTSTNIIFASVEVFFNAKTAIWLRKTRKEIRTVQQSKNRKREMKLFIQCFLTGSVFTFAALFYALFFAVRQWAQPGHFILMHFAWIGHHVINPVIYFCMNSKLRRLFVSRFMCCSKFRSNYVADISITKTMTVKPPEKY